MNTAADLKITTRVLSRFLLLDACPAIAAIGILPRGLIFNLIDYIDLLDWTGRIIRDDKRGAIDKSTPSILQRLDISTEHWIELATSFEQRFEGIAGSAQSIEALCAHFGLTRSVNRSNSQLLYG